MLHGGWENQILESFRILTKVQNTFRGIFRKGRISLEFCTVDEIEFKKKYEMVKVSFGWPYWPSLKWELATHSSILAWKIPWTEESWGLQSVGLQRVGHDWLSDWAFPLIISPLLGWKLFMIWTMWIDCTFCSQRFLSSLSWLWLTVGTISSQVALVVKNLPANARDIRDTFDPWVKKILWRRKWQPTPVLLPGKFHRGDWQATVYGSQSWTRFHD